MMAWKTLLLIAAVLAAPAQRPSAGYDPSRDPAQDLENLIKQNREGKRILLVVGGEWCSWCHTLEAYVKDEPEIQAAWSASFLTLKVNFSRENENKTFLSRYPEISGYPHIFVLDKDGKLLHSQDSSPLESGKSYSKEKMKAFLEKWKA